MRLTLYYCLHTFINQVKKLFNSWVIIFILICFALGASVGLIAAKVEEKTSADKETAEEAVSEEEEEEETLAEMIGVEKGQLMEAGVGLFSLMILAFMVINADKRGSAIFMRADAVLLFASPMKPQSVLMFRLVVQMLSIVIIACLYLPNLVMNMELSGSMALLFVFGFILLFCIGLMIEMLLYCLSSTHPRLRSVIKPIIYGSLILIAGGFLLFFQRSNEPAAVAAVQFFAGKGSRWIPIWGWIKGLFGFALEGNGWMSLAMGAMSAAALVGLIYLVWHVKADYYESALAKSEETAAMLEKQMESKSLVSSAKIRKTDREERIRRDGLNRGWGANVLFFKNMYNRFRFAHLHVLTKGMELCLAAAIAAELVARFAFESNSFLPLVITLGILTFYKTMNSPMEQDTAMEYFLLIPESPWKKLGWSLLADVCGCLMDILPALAVGILIGQTGWETLMWLPFLISIDVYGSVVGTFMAHALPSSLDGKIKQLGQILFVEFGLLPVGLIMLVGIMSEKIVMAAVAATIVNLVLAAVVFAVTPLIIDPSVRRDF